MPSETNAGGWRQRVLLAASVLILVIAGILVWRGLQTGPDYSLSTDRWYKCAECGREFVHTLQVGDLEPLKCPECGKNTAWAAEACYWTKDGKAKIEPTRVIVKQRMGQEGKTYCPDCGREVKGHNPLPPNELMEEARTAGRKH